jgi:hypothetical protein
LGIAQREYVEVQIVTADMEFMEIWKVGTLSKLALRQIIKILFHKTMVMILLKKRAIQFQIQ